MPVQTILIVGGSTRAAAFSALRAGLTPRCVDWFADRDLAAACAVQRVDAREGIAGLERAALALAPGPWLYTGPLENHADRVEHISTIHRLQGNAACTLRSARDPVRLVAVLRSHELPALDVRSSAERAPHSGTWLIKPVASAGGRGIQRLEPAALPCPEPCYLQQFMEGASHSALFVAHAGGGAELVGVTRQLTGIPGAPFLYRGSIGPCTVHAELRSVLERIGDAIQMGFGLRGLFGVDYIVDQCGQPWPVELNPRYTASVEVLELATGRARLGQHLRTCGSGRADSPARPASYASGCFRPRVVGKAIVYARCHFVAPEIDMGCPPNGDRFAIPAFADVPQPGTEIAAGEPILTVFAAGHDIEACERLLGQAEASWRERLLA